MHRVAFCVSILNLYIMHCSFLFYSVIEMQALIVELIENFQFSLPAGGVDIQRSSAGFMIPLIRGKIEEGAQVPLTVSLVN